MFYMVSYVFLEFQATDV